MTPKPLEEEVAGLEWLFRPTRQLPYSHAELTHINRTVPRLIADWRARGQEIERLRQLDNPAARLKMTDNKLDLEELERLFEKLNNLFLLAEGDWSVFHKEISSEWPALRNAAPKLFERVRELEKENEYIAENVAYWHSACTKIEQKNESLQAHIIELEARNSATCTSTLFDLQEQELASLRVRIAELEARLARYEGDDE